jgi:hypothetical protein
MDQRLVELYIERGRLRERIGAQRGQLVDALEPLSNALHTVDRVRVLMEQAKLWLMANPGVVAAVAVAIVVWRPRRILRTVLWGFSAWRSMGRWREWVRIGLRVL